MADHLALPLRVSAGGRLTVVRQDSGDDVAQSVALVLSTRPGERISVPDYGTPSPLFGAVNLTAITSAIDTWEPRAGGYDVEVTGSPASPVVTVILPATLAGDDLTGVTS